MRSYISLVNKSFEFVGFDTNIVRAYGTPSNRSLYKGGKMTEPEIESSIGC